MTNLEVLSKTCGISTNQAAAVMTVIKRNLKDQVRNLYRTEPAKEAGEADGDDHAKASGR